MEITIDNQTVTLDLPSKPTRIEQLFEEVEIFLLSQGKITQGVSINDQSLSPKELEKKFQETLKGNEKFQFVTIPIEEFILEHLEGAHESNKTLVKNIKTFADELNNPPLSVNPTLIIEEFKLFLQFWAQLNSMFPTHFAGLKFDQLPFPDFVKKTQELLEEIVQALEDHDLVLASDLLEYEIIPLVKSVQSITPQLKKRFREKQEKE
ncbi:hypothetical protein JYU14_02990 [Simkania negevensis]|uniref:Uncharacterized protein n=1 Tax=Simkania negevensis TaxID=83561 RepID=A0ABS3ATR3_9BACT|nr:hypothetical protein [Simkania negevensis]